VAKRVREVGGGPGSLVLGDLVFKQKITENQKRHGYTQKNAGARTQSQKEILISNK
jgi:hypothetical protein